MEDNMSTTHSVGTHAIFDIHMDKDHVFLTKPKPFLDLMKAACLAQGATFLKTECHGFGDDQGFTFTFILSESHASCHTWPEHGMATFDIFMCGKCNSFDAMESFKEELRKVYTGTARLSFHETKLFRGFYFDDATE